MSQEKPTMADVSHENPNGNGKVNSVFHRGVKEVEETEEEKEE